MPAQCRQSRKGKGRKLTAMREREPFAAMVKHERDARAVTAKPQGRRMQADGEA
jgi:hypothetical protein